MRRDLYIFGYCVIGFLSIVTLIAIVRAIVLTINNSTPEGVLYTLGLILILLISLFGFLTFVLILLGLGVFGFLSYWVGKWFIG